MSETGSSPMSSRLGRVKRWAKIAAVILIVGVPARLVCRTTVRLWSAIAVAERDDPHWRLADLSGGRPAVPDAENGAPILEEAGALMPEEWPPALPARDGEGAVDAFVQMVRCDDLRRLGDDSIRTLREELARRREPLQVALRLVDYPRGRPTLAESPEPFDQGSKASAAAYPISRLLGLAAVVAARDGRLDDAIEACRAGVGVARAVGDEPATSAQLARLSALAGAARTSGLVLALGEPPPGPLARLQRELMSERDASFARDAQRGDRAEAFEAHRRLAESGGFRSLKGLALGLMFRSQQAEALRRSNDLLAIIARPEPEWTPALREWQEGVHAAKRTTIGRFTSPLLSQDATVAHSTLRVRAEVGAVAILIAAGRQRQATGKWPASAADIDPDILPEPPLDPYTGKSFRLEYSDGRLRVYSLGANLRDERGAYDYKKADTEHVEDDVGAFAYDPELRGRPAADGGGGAPPGS